MLPSITALRCFEASARLGSFTRAAQEVHLTQGAVSHQILGLEEQLGVPLFVRRRAGLELTAAGRSYWKDVSAALRQLERATQDVVAHQGAGGSLNLSVASSLATYWLVPRLSGFTSAHPEVTLNLSTRIGPVDFTEAALDAAIEFCEGAAPGLRAVPVMPLVLRPFASPALLRQHGLAARKPSRAALARLLAQAPLIRHTTVPGAWSGWLAAAGLGDEVPARHAEGGPRYDLLSMAHHGTMVGIGISLLPDYLASGASRGSQLVQLSDVAWTAEKAYYLRYPAARAELPALRSFEAWLVTK